MAADIDGAPEQAKVRLELAVSAVAAGAELRYSIANVGEMSLLFGAGYRFERHTAKGWEHVPMRMAFPAWGRRIAPGEASGEMVARVPRLLESGRYRLLTWVLVLRADGPPVGGLDGPIRVDASGDFCITG